MTEIVPNVKTGKGGDIMVILEKFKSQKDEIVNRTCLSHKFKGKNVKWEEKLQNTKMELS